MSDVCFNGSSFVALSTVVTTLVGTITTLFGLLMLSYRGRIQAAETREGDAIKDRDSAYKERNEALWRLQETRTRYREFVNEQGGSVLSEPRYETR